MKNIRLTKEFSFECAHALTGYDGKCSNIHGHSYKLFVTIKGATNGENGEPKEGMVIDFRDIKEMVERVIIKVFDHSLVITKETPLASELKGTYPNIVLLPFRPTSENLISHFAELLMEWMERNPKFSRAKVYSLRLYETATSYAEWFAEDNID